ncbi:hypothetical protein CEXT_191621 [Caerostris extrusa]|uniref:Uncharacterized protein n=1 Tax=Caerostris extrusa TaxID=172846 RepID=A0AAV4RBP0_CAEEX|nr:hypothetical protein CEXT_191621 [Caerostris extrusa]
MDFIKKLIVDAIIMCKMMMFMSTEKSSIADYCEEMCTWRRDGQMGVGLGRCFMSTVFDYVGCRTVEVDHAGGLSPQANNEY